MLARVMDVGVPPVSEWVMPRPRLMALPLMLKLLGAEVSLMMMLPTVKPAARLLTLLKLRTAAAVSNTSVSLVTGTWAGDQLAAVFQFVLAALPNHVRVAGV